ncbi:hypothetical protein FEF26_14955 [Nesterenkonia salmonea]|uniref:PD-(D/E)XK nuclease family protein n=1 Tax=Nesterenkonia salmonea TaxID=1804987 RepID=A0A5R9B6V7_9MICC|nr:PD-(D/E)XK nuclease family protein [Nesterenkonia salmonea]TLP92238.1 hypothetical protein FEF26_14955 [Nesterenkonia salmonea]
MSADQRSVNDFVTRLLPGLSRSLAEEFNVFRVMHHGTHEKQLSNVFAWLLRDDATHELGGVFQRIFLSRVNGALSQERKIPATGYRIFQEVQTESDEQTGMDIADLLLVRDDAALAVENYGTSDGHGHDYYRYLAHAAGDRRKAVVVLLCMRHMPHLLQDGWEQAVVVTYSEVLSDLKNYVARDRSWRDRHPEQHFFLQQMFHQFVEGPAAVNLDDQLAFIKIMCETGEASRYGASQRDRAAEEFADIVAEHARRQFEEGRTTLRQVKASLRDFTRTQLLNQVNEAMGVAHFDRVTSNWQGQWEWSVKLGRASGDDAYVTLRFGPTAVATVNWTPGLVSAPDYSRIFVADSPREEGFRVISQTEVTLSEVLAGLGPGDLRLRDAVLKAIPAD